LKDKEKRQMASDSEEDENNAVVESPKANCPLLPFNNNHSVENVKHQFSRQQRVAKVYMFEHENLTKNVFDNDYMSD
jgi:hypothetical protein